MVETDKMMMNEENQTTTDNLEQIIEEAQKKLEGEKQQEQETESKDEQPQAQTQQQTQPYEQILELEVIKQLYTNIFRVVAMRAGEHWEISEVESEMLAKPTKAVLDKYAIKMTPEMSLILSFAVVLTPRIVLTLTKEKKNEQ